MQRIIIFFILVFFSFPTFAQIVEKSITMSMGEQNGMEADIIGDSKEAEKAWKNYVKNYGKLDWDKKNKEYVLTDARISSISAEKITIITQFNNYRDNSKGAFWFKSGDKFLSSLEQPIVFENAINFIVEFGYSVERNTISEELKSQEKELEQLEKDLAKLIKKNQGFHEDIEKAKQEIKNKEKDIEVNLNDQEGKNKDIKEQREVLKKISMKLANVGKKG